MIQKVTVLGVIVVSLMLNTYCANSSKDDDKAPIEPSTLPDGKKMPPSMEGLAEFFFSEQEYAAQGDATATEISERVGLANKFALALYKTISEESDNIVISPLSIQTAFSLLYPATEDNSTAGNEIATALGFGDDRDSFNQAMKSYLVNMDSAFSGESSDQRLEWSLVNQVWVDKAYGLQDSYLDTIKIYYNSGAAALDFGATADQSRQLINDFIALNTNDLIKDLLPPGSIDALTRVVLTNSVYMLADWAKPFEKNNTYTEDFETLSSGKVQADMMRQTGSFKYYETSEYQALAMSYIQDHVAMLVVLPGPSQQINSFETGFDEATFASILENLESQSVSVNLPKFTLEWGTSSLKEGLQALGMTKVFSAATDNFPKLLAVNGEPATDLDLYISDVYHKAKIIVDEKGTEAAAATAIVNKVTSVDPGEPKVFTVDHPALFFIYDTEHKGILFMGRIADPS